MAIYTTFFLAKPEQLLGGFAGWKLPLQSPVQREFQNPFTKKTVIIQTREPEWSEGEEKSTSPQYRVVSIQGRYEDYVENRLPSFVRECQHWAAKGLTDVELEPLLNAIGIQAELESPIYAPPSSGAVMLEFSADFIPRLIAATQSEITKLWAAEMSTPKHTHSVTGRKLRDGWTADHASQLVTPIISLACDAVAGQRMYLLIEA